MPTLLTILADAMRRLAGDGAADNAAYEVDRAVRSVVEIDARLHGVAEPPPRAA